MQKLLLLKNTRTVLIRRFSSTPENNIPEINPCLYTTLNVEKECNKAEIRTAYLNLAREFHPDKNPEALDYFTHATKAYETLHDTHKRAAYDDE